MEQKSEISLHLIITLIDMFSFNCVLIRSVSKEFVCHNKNTVMVHFCSVCDMIEYHHNMSHLGQMKKGLSMYM